MLTLLEMIAEWRKGCSCAGPAHDDIFHPKHPTSPSECEPCTTALIDAMEKVLKAQEERNLAPFVIEYALHNDKGWTVTRVAFDEFPDGVKDLYNPNWNVAQKFSETKNNQPDFYILEGIRNPVEAAKLCLEHMGVSIDVESFDRVAKRVGDKDPFKGSVVNYDTLQQLCEIGHFVIAMVDGKLKAFGPC